MTGCPDPAEPAVADRPGEVKQIEGKESLKTEYGYFGRSVVITRSAKDGVEVQLLEKGRDKLVWKLGSC